uniref:Uncharacterized protein n=1 Tax=viral metagenome TaxID=1070528 RepID=A0A6M3LGJ3_9ZZZZ
MQTLTVSGGSCTPQRERYIPAQLNNLRSQIDGLESAFESLRDRLGSIRRSEPPTPVSAQVAKPETAEINCEIAEAIRQQVNRIFDLRERIDYQLETLEV